MTNHIHLILIPLGEDSLSRAVGRTQGRYSQYVNSTRSDHGHLWQDRFFSCPLGEAHRFHALRYVDRNPVRAGLVIDPINYPWSSARAHTGVDDPSGLIDQDLWRSFVGDLDWQDFVAQEEDLDKLDEIRRNTRLGLPLKV